MPNPHEPQSALTPLGQNIPLLRIRDSLGNLYRTLKADQRVKEIEQKMPSVDKKERENKAAEAQQSLTDIAYRLEVSLWYQAKNLKKDQKAADKNKADKKEPSKDEDKSTKKERPKDNDLKKEKPKNKNDKKDNKPKNKPSPPKKGPIQALADTFAIAVLGVINKEIAGGIQPVVQIDAGVQLPFPIVTPTPGRSASGEVIDYRDQEFADPMGTNDHALELLVSAAGVQLRPDIVLTLTQEGHMTFQQKPQLALVPEPTYTSIPSPYAIPEPKPD